MSGNASATGELHEILSDAKALFSRGPLLSRTIQRLRPYICPFHRLLALVPAQSSVLDVGCGSGLFLGLLVKQVGLRAALGFDSSKPAIELATTMRRTLPPETAEKVTFEHRDASQSWPKGVFDIVSMIDVMHHVSPAAQHEVFLRAVDRVAPGGLLLYKDMGQVPVSFALANRLHDLLLARQWIHYVPIARIRTWGREAGLRILEDTSCRMLWYVHEWVVFEKPDAAD